MKPADVNSNTYIDFGVENDNKDPKVKVGDYGRIQKYKNISAKLYTPNWSEKGIVIKKVRNTVSWTYVIVDDNGEKTVGTFYKKELQSTNQTEFRVEKVIKKNGDKLYFIWKGCK